jgi:hypothetical protein
MISDDGLDVRLTNAMFGKIKINSGVFFVSNKDNSWIGKVDAVVPISDIALYARDLSTRLAALPLEKLNISGYANLHMKLLRVKGDDNLKRDLPFRIIEGEGVIKSDDNTKDLKLFWNSEKLFVSGDVATGKSKINLRLNENFKNNSGSRELLFTSGSDFLDALVPGFTKICNGNYMMKIDSLWNNDKMEHDVSVNLKDATMNIPMMGDVKSSREEGTFTAHVLDNGKIFEFSKMLLDTPSCNIKGTMTMGSDGNLIKCTLDNFKSSDSSAKINFLREGDHMAFSAVGDCMDITKVMSIFDKVEKNVAVSAYLSLKEVILSSSRKIKNVKGSLDLKNGKIVGGACYGVIGNDTTLALTAKDITNTDDVLLALSISNAAEFLREFKITDTVIGGDINVVTKLSKNVGASFSGAFEMNDFVVKNNAQLTKLISLSSTNYLQSTDNFSVGFNFCMGNFTVTDGQITIENGKAISPTMAISYTGSYDRTGDSFYIQGISLPMSAFLNNINASGGSLAAHYVITGSLGVPVLSVKPLKFFSNDSLNEIFGNMLPMMITPETAQIVPLGNSTDPFSQGAFDKKVDETVKKNLAEKSQPLRRVTNDRFGIKIIRGVKHAN